MRNIRSVNGQSLPNNWQSLSDNWQSLSSRPETEAETVPFSGDIAGIFVDAGNVSAPLGYELNARTAARQQNPMSLRLFTTASRRDWSCWKPVCPRNEYRVTSRM
jgi:hypothetical protein